MSVVDNGRRTVVIAGAGPSGLMAAISAAASGCRVTVYEQLSLAGAKLLASGGGKCNLTNVLPVNEFAAEFGRQWRFTLPAFNQFSPEDLRSFFAVLGVPTVVEDGFHVFPTSNKAGDVLNALLGECARLKVKIVCSAVVSKLVLKDGAITGVVAGGSTVEAGRVIIACGGRGYPKLGGRGIGYILAKQVGHRIIEPVPGLSGLRTVEHWPGECAGISFGKVESWLDLPGGYRNRLRSGELLFTHNGISGPAIIDFAADVSMLLKKHAVVRLKINLFAEHKPEYWRALFDKWQVESGKKYVRNLLAQYMPHAIADQLCMLAGNIGEVRAAEFKSGERNNLVSLITALPLNINATENWDKAMVTRGGVTLKEVCPETLESRLVHGLHFAGEVLELDGPCGGYNLQWAFASGKLAGASVAE